MFHNIVAIFFPNYLLFHMKNFTVFGLALTCILAVLYLGANGLSSNYSWGPFFIFIGACSTIGFTIDLFNHFRTKGSR